MYDLEELVEYLYIEEYEDGFLFCRTFNNKAAEQIMVQINYKAYYLLRDCENLCEEVGNEFYKNLILECFELVDDLENFNGGEQNFYNLLDNLDNKIKKILDLLSTNNDEFSNQLSDKLYEICKLYDFY